MKHLQTLASAVLILVSSIVFAHHSNTPFDMSQTLHATGIVEAATFKNPHSVLTLKIATSSGTESITFEGHSLATLRHYGLGPGMVNKGDTLTISYAPRRDKQAGGIFLSITTSSGETLDFSHLGYD